MLRNIVVLAFTAGGVWLALRGVEEVVHRTGIASHVNPWSGSGLLLTAPALIVGALFGAFVGGLFLPMKR